MTDKELEIGFDNLMLNFREHFPTEQKRLRLEFLEEHMSDYTTEELMRCANCAFTVDVSEPVRNPRFHPLDPQGVRKLILEYARSRKMERLGRD